MPGSSSTVPSRDRRCGPSCTDEIAADPMPRAVIEIEPGFPQRAAREGVEVLPARALGEARVAMAICAFSTSP